MSVVIRDLAATDRAQWNVLWAGYLAFYESSLDPAVTDATFARLLDPAEPMFAFVAEENSTLLGFVHNVVHRATWTLSHYCYLEDLFVAQAARGKGVGRALIETTYKRADDIGCSRVYWLTHETNITARKLYDAVALNLGFIQYRRP